MADTSPLEPAGPTPVREPDPRVERSRRVILGAALDLLIENGYGGLNIEAVAARAGVGKSTIYRHWPGKLELVEDAVRTLKAGISLPQGNSVRDRVVALLRLAATNVADSAWSACLPALIDAAERDSEVKAIHCRLAEQRRQVLINLLAEGVLSGEVSPDQDLGLLADCLFGPILVRRLLFHEPFNPDDVPRLVDLVLRPRSRGSKMAEPRHAG